MQTVAAPSRSLSRSVSQSQSPSSSPAQAQSRGANAPGARFVVMCLVTLGPLIATLTGSGLSKALSAIIVAAFAVLVPATLYVRRGALYLALASATLLVVSFAAIPMDSAAFSVDRWSSLVMFLLALTAVHQATPKPGKAGA